MDSESADSCQHLPKDSDVQTPAEATSDVKKSANSNDIKNHANTNDVEAPVIAHHVEPPLIAHHVEPPKPVDNAPTFNVQTISSYGSLPSVVSPTGITSWTRNSEFPQPTAPSPDTEAVNGGTSAFTRFTSGIGLRLQLMTLPPDDSAEHITAATQAVLETFKKGVIDSSRSAVKAVQVKARHIFSQNKRRYQVA